MGLESRANNSITYFISFMLFGRDLGVVVRFQSKSWKVHLDFSLWKS